MRTAPTSHLQPALRRHLVNHLLGMADQCGEEQLQLLLGVAEAICTTPQVTAPTARPAGTCLDPRLNRAA
jgi:hypothetical protein